MELQLCAACDGYVRPEWADCANCGASLHQADTPAPARSSGAHFKDGALDHLEEWVDTTLSPTVPTSNMPTWDPNARPEDQSIRLPVAPAPSVQDTAPVWTPEATAPKRKVPRSSIDGTKIALIAGGLGLVALVGAAILSVVVIVSLGGQQADAVAKPVPTTAAPASTWVSFKDPGEAFTVELPAEGMPKATAGATTVEAVYNDGANRVDVSYVVVGPSRGDDQLFTDFLSDARKSGYEVRSSFSTSAGTRKNLNARLFDTQTNSYGDVFVTRVDDRLYVISLWSADASGDPQTFYRVTESFKPALR